MKLRATTILRYKGSYNEPLVATRLEIAWDDDKWLDISGLRRYEVEEWSLLLALLLLGARKSGVTFIHYDVENKVTELSNVS